MASEPLALLQLETSAGLSLEDMPLYLDRGLISPPRRMPDKRGGSALHREHVERLHFIARAQAYGFSLDAIGQILSSAEYVHVRRHFPHLARLQALLGPNAPSVAGLQELADKCHGSGTREDCLIYRTLADLP